MQTAARWLKQNPSGQPGSWILERAGVQAARSGPSMAERDRQPMVLSKIRRQALLMSPDPKQMAFDSPFTL
jgi:hypothetical protein